MNPKRIQRKRTKGWKMPENTKCVNRLSKFANPFFIHVDFLCIRSNHLKSTGHFPLAYVGDDKSKNHEILVDCYKRLLQGERKFYGIDITAPLIIQKVHVPSIPEIKAELSKYDHLACFCSLDLPCHADVLLDVIKTN